MIIVHSLIDSRGYVEANNLSTNNLSTLRNRIETTNYFKDPFYNYSLQQCSNRFLISPNQ